MTSNLLCSELSGLEGIKIDNLVNVALHILVGKCLICLVAASNLDDATITLTTQRS